MYDGMKCPKSASKVCTRSTTEVFLLGQPQPKICSSESQLPCSGDVMRFIHYMKNKPGAKFKPIAGLLSCPLKTGTHDASCSEPGGCCNSDGDKCVVAALKHDGVWLKSGIPIISDYSIALKLRTLYNRWCDLQRLKNRTNPKEVVKRNAFVCDMSSLLDISAKDAIMVIEKDRLRSQQARNQDVEFLFDQQGPRKMGVQDCDKKMEKSVRDKRSREAARAKSAQKNSTQTPQPPALQDADGCDDAEMTSDSDASPDFDIRVPKRQEKKPEYMDLRLKRKCLVKDTTMTSKRFHGSTASHTAMLANIVNAGGGSVYDLPLSKTTVWRHRTAATAALAQRIRDCFKQRVKRPLTLHFVGKIVKEFTNGKKRKKDRLAVLVTSADPPMEQLLGVPPIDSSSGVNQMEAIMTLVTQWDIRPHEDVFAMVCDTTSSNTGKRLGACSMIQQKLNKALLWLVCRRHVYELHVKRADRKVTGKTSGPEVTLFLKLQERWEELSTAQDLYANLTKFNWAGNSDFIQDQASSSRRQAELHLATGVFPRGDYRELNELLVVWLGGNMPNFNFRWPGACHRARFMMQSIYYLKMELLKKHLTFLSDDESVQISRMAEFVGLFFGVWFLRSSVAAAAPRHDLEAIDQMRRYREEGKKRAEVAAACLDSLDLHQWYLDPSLVVFALADEGVPKEERQALGFAVADAEQPQTHAAEKPRNTSVVKTKHLAPSVTLPSLAERVSSRSMLLFEMLGMTSADVAWLREDVDVWPLRAGFRTFKALVDGLVVVNDPAERHIHQIQQYIGMSHEENRRQDDLLVVSAARKAHGSCATKVDLSAIR